MTLAGHPSAAHFVDSNDDVWLLATCMDERIAAPRPVPGASAPSGTTPPNAALRSQFPYSDDELFAEILHRRNVSPEDFSQLCEENAQQVRRRFDTPPEWLERLHGLPLAAGSRASGAAWAAGSPQADPRLRQLEPFLDFFRPLLDRASDVLVAGVRATVRATNSPLDPEHLGVLLARSWPRRAITRLVMRVLLLELNIARLRGSLNGADSTERFADFAARLRDPAHSQALWRAYPVLLRECTALLDAWTAARLEFCAHLCTDLSAMSDLAPGSAGQQPDHIRFEAGDGHRGGRSVGIVTFAGGQQVVYKPRSLDVDRHIQEILKWANDAGFEPGFPTLELVCRDDHGWSQFVASTDCAHRDQIARFYRRHGGYLALAHVLRGTDLHFENVIASGEYPYLVDLEALFGAELRRSGGPGDKVAERLMTSTVLATGLLPNPIVRFEEDRQERTDVSGITYRAGQLSFGEVPMWTDPGADTMRIVHQRIPMGASRNAPSLNGVAVDPAHFVPEIVAGFTDLYRILADRKEKLAGPGGLLERFRDDTVRRVLEATQTYSTVLWDSYHPNLLRNAVDRDQYLDRAFARYPSCPHGFDIAASERSQLAQGDIPLFTSRVGGRELRGADGTVIENALATSGLQAVRDRVRALSSDDLQHQTWVIESAFACVSTEDLSSSWPEHTVTGRADGNAVDPQILMAHARAIGDKLLATALRADDEIGWLGITPAGTSAWRLAPTANGLYSGTPGIALFLLQLAQVTGDSRYHEAAAAVAHALARRARQDRELPPPPAGIPTLGLSGEVGGGLYFAAHWSAVTDDPHYLSALLSDLGPRLERSIGEAAGWDVVDGLAGTLLGLSAAHSVLRSRYPADLMTRCADAIMQAGAAQSVGVGWYSAAGGDHALCGMAHGASGITLALARCSMALGTSRYREVIDEALRYEEHVFDPEHHLWPDLRSGSGQTTMTAWCHGAPGIGLTRAVLSTASEAHLASRALDDLATALDTTAAAYSSSKDMTVRNVSLCHGELGNLEFVSTASSILNSEVGRGLAERIAGAVCATLDEHGPVCGVPDGLSTPGLMTGIAGIGHGLLRLAAPEHVPSVLTLAPPRQG